MFMTHSKCLYEPFSSSLWLSIDYLSVVFVYCLFFIQDCNSQGQFDIDARARTTVHGTRTVTVQSESLDQDQHDIHRTRPHTIEKKISDQFRSSGPWSSLRLILRNQHKFWYSSDCSVLLNPLNDDFIRKILINRLWRSMHSRFKYSLEIISMHTKFWDTKI